MDPSTLSDGELDLLEYLHEESQRPLVEHPVKHDCFECRLAAKSSPPILPEGNPVPWDQIPDALLESVELLTAKNLATLTATRTMPIGRAVRLTDSGKQVHREYLRQRQQARYEQRLRGNPTSVINIHDSHGFIAGSQRDFIQNNPGDF